MALYSYQSQLVARIDDELRIHNSILLQLPTAGGKTRIAVALVRRALRRGERVWFICHRREIIRQTCDALREGRVPFGVIAPKHKRTTDCVQVCSVDTVRFRLKRLQKLKLLPDIVVWDECHHLPALSWAAIRKTASKSLHVGLTATPVRLDGAGLGQFFDRMIVGPSTRSLIERGYLSDFRVFAPSVPDLHGIKLGSNDYAKQALAARMSTASLVGDAIEHYKRLAPDARAIAFAVSVAASKDITLRFIEAGIAARHIDARTPTGERDQAITDLAAGRIKVLSSVDVFTEGFDLPAIDAVILLRPTKSLALYRQMVGRGLRPKDGRKAIILDHASLVHEHGLPDDEIDWSLEGCGSKPRHPKSEKKLRLCPQCAAVHAWAPFCEECGHEYQSQDRSIEEVFGELQEIRRPPGHETIREFAARLGMDASNARKTLRRLKCPMVQGGYIEVEPALAWLRTQKTSGNVLPLGWSPGEAESTRDFAKRVGMSRGGVIKLLLKGLPQAPNGWVHVEPALRWLAQWKKKHKPKPPAAKPARLHETAAAFAERLSCTPSYVETLKKRGLPLDSNGRVIVAEAMAMISDGRLPKPTGRSVRRPVGYETTCEFARRVGVSKTGGRRTLIMQGLPIAENGYVKISEGLAWMAKRER